MPQPTYDIHIRFMFEEIKMIDRVHTQSPMNRSQVVRALVRAGCASLYPQIFTDCTGLHTSKAGESFAPEITQEPSSGIHLGLTDSERDDILRAQSPVNSPRSRNSDSDKPITLDDIMRIAGQKPEDKSI